MNCTGSVETDFGAVLLLLLLHLFASMCKASNSVFMGMQSAFSWFPFSLVFHVKGSCSTAAFMSHKFVRLSVINVWPSSHPDWLSLIKRRHVHQNRLEEAVAVSKITHCRCFLFLTPRLSVCCIFCFWPACQKKCLPMVRQHEKAPPKTEDVTNVLLNQKPKHAKLSHCTPLDRVLIHVCALLHKSCQNMSDVVLLGWLLLGNNGSSLWAF